MNTPTQNLRHNLVALPLSLEDIAERADVSLTALRRWMKGEFVAFFPSTAFDRLSALVMEAGYPPAATDASDSPPGASK